MFSLMEDLAPVSPCNEVWLHVLYEDFSIVFSNSLPDVTSPQEDVVGLVKHLLATEELSKGAGLQIPLLLKINIFCFIIGGILTGKGVILAGFPRTLAQGRAFERLVIFL